MKIRVKNIVKLEDLGIMNYAEAWDYQSKVHQMLRDNKLAEENRDVIHHLIFVEHPHVYTLGKSGDMSNLLMSESALKGENVDFFKINRGGDITYHGPGQIVVYPVFDLDCFKNDVRWYVEMLEETVIRTLDVYGVKGKRIDKYTGVWIDDPESKIARKICAIGVHMSRWVTLHGLAFNINTILSYFEKIVPCGIIDPNKSVTSLSKELGHELKMEEVKKILQEKFREVFDFEYLKVKSL